MYKVYLDNELLYHPNVADKLPLESTKLDIELNKTGKFAFTIRENNPQYGNIKKMKSIIRVYDDNHRMFRGRAYSTQRGFQKQMQVTCEGELAFLLDTKVRPYTFQGSVAEYFAFLVNNHNSRVKDEWKKFKLGRCTVVDPNNYITRENGAYPNTLDEIKNKLIGILGGYIWTREEEDGIYLDYLADFEETNSQKIKFGENLLDFDEVIKANDMATVIIPLGCHLVDEEGNDTGERLTIASVNNGLDYIYDANAVEKFGWIEKVIEFDDVTEVSNLLRKGREALQESIGLTQSIELSAVDLKALNLEIQSFHLGKYSLVESKPHDFDERMLTRKLTVDILSPSNSNLLLGDEKKAFTDKHVQTNQSIRKVEVIANTAQINAGNVQNAVDSLEEKVIINETNISQNSEEISALASRTQGNEQSIALLEVTAGGLNSEVSKVKDGLTAAQTSIVQNAENIKSKVSKGDVSTEISQESGKVKITGGRLIVDSDNFKLHENGDLEVHGKYTAEFVRRYDASSFSLEQATRARQIAAGYDFGDVTQEELDGYDLYGDGFDLLDAILMMRLASNYYDWYEITTEIIIDPIGSSPAIKAVTYVQYSEGGVISEKTIRGQTNISGTGMRTPVIVSEAYTTHDIDGAEQNGATGTFTSADGKTITVVNGIVVMI